MKLCVNKILNLSFIVLMGSSLSASIKFGSPEARVLLNSNATSLFKTSQAKKITGWSNESIVRAHSGQTADSWVAKLENATEYGFSKLFGVKPATERLLYSTSNAIGSVHKNFRFVDENTIFFPQNSSGDIQPLNQFRTSTSEADFYSFMGDSYYDTSSPKNYTGGELYPPLRATSNWVANNTDVINVAVRALNLAQNAQYKITGLAQGFAQNAFDISGTTTSSYTYTDSGSPCTINSIAWHPLGQYLAIARTPGSSAIGGATALSFHTYNSTFQQMGLGHTDIGTSYKPSTVAWNPAGTILAVGANDTTTGSAKVILFYYSKDSLMSYTVHTLLDSCINRNSYVTQVAWSPDGKNLAVAGSSLSGTNLANRKQLLIYEVGPYEAPTGGVCYKTLGPVRLRATRSVDGSGEGLIESVAWHPDGFILAYAVRGCSRHVDRPPLALANYDGTNVNVVDYVFPVARSEAIKSVAFDPTGSYLAVGTNSATLSAAIYRVYHNGFLTPYPTSPLDVSLFNTATPIMSFSTTTTINSVAWSPDGAAVVWAHNGYNLYSFKNGTANAVESRRGYKFPINSTAWLPNGRKFALAGRNLDGSADMVLYDVSASFSDTLARTTSNAVNASGSLQRTTSNALSSYMPWLRATSRYLSGTSNWVNQQFNAFGASTLGMQLRGTSNWANRQSADLGNAGVGMCLRTTSNWVNQQFNAFGASTLGMQLRGISSWVNNQYIDAGNDAALGRNLRGTSVWVTNQTGAAGLNSPALGRHLRTTTNWLDRQRVDFGAGNLGLQLRGTSNWAANQVNDFGSPNLGTRLRTTSNVVNRYKGVIVGSSNWVNVNADLPNVALRGLNLGQSAGYKVVGLQQAFAQNVFDLTATATAYADSVFYNSINALAWHPLGQHIAVARSAGGSGSVTINAYNSTLSASDINGQSASSTFVDTSFIPQTLAWSPSGKALAIGANNSGAGRAKVYIAYYDDLTNALILNTTILDSSANSNALVKQVAWSPDGKYLAVVGRSLSGTDFDTQQLHIYNAGSYDGSSLGSTSLISTFQHEQGSGGVLYGVSWHPSSKMLAIAGDQPSGRTGGYFYTINFTGIELERRMQGANFLASGKSYLCISYDPTGRYLALGSDDATNTGMIFEIDKRGLNTHYPFAYEVSLSTGTPINSVAWSPDGASLVWAYNGYNLYSYKNAAGATVSTRRGYRYPITSVAWHPNGRSFILGGDYLDSIGRSMYSYDVTAESRLVRTTSNWVASKGNLAANAGTWVNDYGSQAQTTISWVNSHMNSVASVEGWVSNNGNAMISTSNWVANNDSWLRATSRTVNNTFPIIRGNSQWVSNNAGVVRTTSNSVSMNIPVLRATSNWVAAKDVLVRTTSNAVVNLNNTSSSVLARTTSNAVNKYVPTVVASSNWVAARSGVLAATSNWVANNDVWLRATSKTVNNTFAIIRGNSQWVSNNAGVVRTTSNSVNVNTPVLRATSNWVAAKDVLVRTTSNAVVNLNNTSSSVLARTTSNAVNKYVPTVLASSNWVAARSGVLAGTSNWVASKGNLAANAATWVNNYGSQAETTISWVNSHMNSVASVEGWVSNNGNAMISTSNWVANNAGWLRATSKTVNNTFPIIRGSSQWVSNNAGVVRTTSNSVSMNTPVLRATSNWVAAKDMLIRTTSNAVNIGSNTLARTTSNAVNKYVPIVIGSSNWINIQTTTDATFLRTTSNAVVAHGAHLDAHDASLNKLRADIATIDAGVSQVDIYSSGYDQTFDLFVSSDNLLRIHSSTTLNGNGHAINFARGRNGIMQLDGRCQVMTTNVVLRDFVDSAVQYGIWSQLTFGRGTVIELAGDTVLGHNWNFAGDVIIKGFGSKLDLAGFSITVESGTLTFENVTLDSVKSESFICRQDSAALRLKDTRLNLAGACDFTVGSLFIERMVTIAGQNTFVFGSYKPLSIASNSMLLLDSNTVFTYAPPIANRDLMVMADKTSVFYLKGSYLTSTTTGMRLTRGSLILESNNNFNNIGAKSLSEAIAIGSGLVDQDLHVEFLPGATINVLGGILDYENVEG